MSTAVFYQREGRKKINNHPQTVVICIIKQIIDSGKKSAVKITDQTGYDTLQAIAQAGHFNRWMYEQVVPYCHGQVLEAGSGIGNISRLLLEDGFEMTLSDSEQPYLEMLREQYSAVPNAKEIISLDLQDEKFNDRYLRLKERFDCIVMMNVLEHLPDAQAAIQHCDFLLRKGGTLIILVPAYSWLYSKMDRELGHQKRYTAATLKQRLENNGFVISRVFYFNALGIVAWLYGKIRRLKKIPAGEMGVFNHLTGIGKLIDKILVRRTGLSVIGVAKKQ